MCSINHDKKAIFIHIPKTAGSYLAKILADKYGFKNYYLQRPDHREFCGGLDLSIGCHENKIHGTMMYYKTSPDLNRQMGMNEEKWRTYYKFCFVRNPYDRIISGWNHVNRYKIPFLNYLDLKSTCNDVEYIHVFMPQVRNIINERGKIGVDFIGNFENLEEDFTKILYKIGFKNIIHEVKKQMNVREHNDFYTYYGQGSLSTVNYLLAEDFRILGAKRFENIKDFFDYYIPKDLVKNDIPGDNIEDDSIGDNNIDDNSIGDNNIDDNSIGDNNIDDEENNQEYNKIQDSVRELNFIDELIKLNIKI
jgi:hypothetical protein